MHHGNDKPVNFHGRPATPYNPPTSLMNFGAPNPHQPPPSRFNAPPTSFSTQTPRMPPNPPPPFLAQIPNNQFPLPPPPRSSSNTQSMPPLHGPPVVGPPSFPNSVRGPNSFQTQADPLHSASRPVQNCLSPSTPGFGAYSGSHVPPPPPIGAQNIQHPMTGPPKGGTLQSLVEDFQSLSVRSVPGSHDVGIDPTSLPRPFNCDEGSTGPSPILESYTLNCDPRYLRLTTHAIPSSQSLLARWHLPLGAVVNPLAPAPEGEEVPIVNFGSAGVIRCRRCRTYVNPYVIFTDGGRKWRCNLCSLLNDVPGEYFSSLDVNGRRNDIDQRPELIKGSVEFVAATEYMVRPPMPPVYFFVIDVSISAVRSGMLKVLTKTIKSCLDDLPGFPRTQIGFLTFDSTLQFYSFKSSLTQPQMMVVADLDDIFLPIPDDLLVNLSDSRHVVDTFLDSFPTMFQDSTNVESALGPALKAAHMVMGQLGGKLLVFQSTLPSLGIGRLRLRGDDSRLYGTGKEHMVMVPEDPFYKQMAAEFTKNQIAVDIYAFSDKYSDLASLGSLAKYTGGQVYHYPSFQSPIHEDKLKHELARDITRETAWEAVMRIRCGKGVRFTTYHGHFMLQSTDLLALPAVDCDKAFAMQFSLEETLMTTHVVYFQVALLYTASSGERRIRVHTAAAPVVTELGEMYRQADTGAIISLLNRLAIEDTLSHTFEDARLLIQLKIVKSLKEYRNLYAVQHRLGGRMIYPESLKYLPLYALSICKSIALRGRFNDVSVDDRCAAGHSMMILTIDKTLKILYPSLYRIDEYLKKDSDDEVDNLKQLALTTQSLDSKGLYLLDDGFNFVIWFGSMLTTDLSHSLLGNFLAHDLSKASVGQCESTPSAKLNKLLNRLRQEDLSSYRLCNMVRQGEQQREYNLFLSKLVEDQSSGAWSYLDWIFQIHRQSSKS